MELFSYGTIFIWILSPQGFKLETFIIAILIHFNSLFIHFCTFSANFLLKNCVMFPALKWAEKKVHKCMNNELKCIKITIMKV